MENSRRFSIEEEKPFKKPGFFKRYLMAKMKRIYRRDRIELQKPLMKFLTSKWFMERDIIAFPQYKLLNNNLNILKEEEVVLKYSFPDFYEKHFEGDKEIKECGGFYKYTIELNNVRLIGGSDIIILNEKYALYDLKFLDREKAFDYTDEAIKFLKNDTVVFETNKSKINLPRGVCFVGNYSANYYHFIIEIISRFEQLDKLKLDKDIPVIMDKSCWDIRQLQELMTLFNIQNRNIIIIEKGVQYEVEQLYYISKPNFIPPNYKDITNIKAQHNLFDEVSLTFIRNTILNNVQKKYNLKKRLFISRKNASGRRRYNESEIYEVIKPYGFSIFYPEEYSAIEQAAIFNQAEFIIGATGAAFTNLLFCNFGCKVICMTNYDLDVSIFCTICKLFGIELLYMYDETLELNKDSDVHIDFNISPNKMKKALEIMLTDTSSI